MTKPLAFCVGLMGHQYDMNFLPPSSRSPLKVHGFLEETYSEEIKRMGSAFKKNISENKNLYWFAFLLLTSFRYREPSYCKIVDCITKNYLKEVAEPRGLKLSGYGGAMMGDIQEISLNFLSFKTLDVDQARIVYVNMMDELLNRINCNDKIRPFLHNYPFEVSNIELMIGFDDVNRKILGDGHVAHMFIGKNNMLYYDTYNSTLEEFYTLHKEPYEEAFRIVKNLKDSLPCD